VDYIVFVFPYLTEYDGVDITSIQFIFGVPEVVAILFILVVKWPLLIGYEYVSVMRTSFW